jgi:long-chain acyl-CoA synthetase
MLARSIVRRVDNRTDPMSARPWIARYDAGVPTTLAPYPSETLLDVLRRQARAYPDAGIRFEGAVTSYRALLARAAAFGRALEERGVRPGDRVALVLPNSPQFLIAELGAWMAGAIVAPMNPLYTEEELGSILARAEAGIAVVLAPFYDRVKRVQERTSVRHVIVAHVRDALPFPKSLLFRLLLEHKDGHGTMPRGDDETMHALLSAYEGDAPRAAAPGPSDTALLLPSGGTTGTPKLVAGSHGGLVASGRQLDAWLGSALERGRDVILLPLPLFHVYAAAGVQALAFTAGVSLALVPNPRETGKLLATIRRERPAFVPAVPALLSSMSRHKDLPRTLDAFRSIKLVFCGAAPLLSETYQTFQRLTGGVIVEGYSLTEAQMAVVCNPVAGTKKLGSVGLPLPDVDLKLVDIETGEGEVPRGEAGEVLMSAPQLMRGYWRHPEETDETLRRDETGRVWLHTGDVGHLDEDGYLVLTDRKKELIKVAGFQVWPREIEEVLVQHPAVLEAGVAGVPDEARGERAKAWVVPRPGATATPAELRAFCESRLAPYKVPREVVFVRELPKSAIGKVLRRKLRELDETPFVPVVAEAAERAVGAEHAVR